LFFFFFFSSRRRHTRSDRDWSSDVCSSDLGGDIVGCASKVVLLDRPGQWLDPGPLGCLGVGPSFALTAKLLHPGRRVLLIAGDGALGLNGMELETAVRLGLPLTVVVGNDGGWGQIRNPQLGFYGEARAVATSLPHTRF